MLIDCSCSPYSADGPEQGRAHNRGLSPKVKFIAVRVLMCLYLPLLCKRDASIVVQLLQIITVWKINIEPTAIERAALAITTIEVRRPIYFSPIPLEIHIQRSPRKQ